MTTLEISDPAMCCATGICGPDPNPRLPQFAADLAWLAEQGVRVARYNLLNRWGPSCLPLIRHEDRIAARGRYPTRSELATIAGVNAKQRP